MPIPSTGMRNDFATTVNTRVNAGSNTSQLVLRTAADADVVSFDLPATAFSISNGVLTLQGVPIESSEAAGGQDPITKGVLVNGNDADELEYSAGVAADDPEIVLSSASPAAGETYTLDSLTTTVPAS